MTKAKTPSIIASKNPAASIDLRGPKGNLTYGSVTIGAGDLSQKDYFELRRAANEASELGVERVVAAEPSNLGGLPTRFTVMPPQDKLN